MDNADVVVEHAADELRGEFLDGVVLVVVVLVLVDVFEIEFLRRQAVAGEQELIAFLEHLILGGLDLVGRLALGHHGAQDRRAAAEVAV